MCFHKSQTEVFMCKEDADRFCGPLSITGVVVGVTDSVATAEQECVKHYEYVITCSVQGTLGIFKRHLILASHRLLA